MLLSELQPRQVRGVISPQDFRSGPMTPEERRRRKRELERIPCPHKKAVIAKARRERILGYIVTARPKAREITKALSIPRSTVYDDLEYLRENGLVNCEPPADVKLTRRHTERRYFLQVD